MGNPRPAYEITIDVADQLIVCSMTGFLAEADVERFLIDIGDAAHRARASFGRVRALVDRSDAAVQSSLSVATMKQSIDDMIQQAEDRVAVVAVPGLGRLQAQRAIEDIPVRLLDTRDQAREWLISDA